MKKTIFEAVLAEKYNITEHFEAVGTFVAFPGPSQNKSASRPKSKKTGVRDRDADSAVGLVSIGLGSRCIAVSRLLLGGQTVDYELVSLTPLSLLTISVYNYAERQLLVDSPFCRKSWIYQLCSSEDREEVWEEFLHEIKRVHVQSYCVPAADYRSSGDAQPEPAMIVPSDTVAVETQCLGHQNKKRSASVCRSYSTRPKSLTDILPGKIAFPNSQMVPKNHTVESMYPGLMFESFVNDNPQDVATDCANISNNAKHSIECTKPKPRKFNLLKRLFGRSK